MTLILLKTEKNVIYEILYRKSILYHEKVVFLQNVFKRPKSLKMDTVYNFRERKCI